MDFKIFNGRSAFYQWDMNQKIVILNSNVSNFEIHFKRSAEQYCLVAKPYTYNGHTVVDVPNVLLQKTDKIVIWVFVNGEYTKEQAAFDVIPKQKPSDYAFTDKEILSYKTLENKISEVEGKSGVTSVNGKKGDLAITLEDVGAGDYDAIKAFTIDRETFSHSGEIVKFDAFGGCPLECVTEFEPIQSGSGDPSPDNIRPISGRTGATLTRSGKNLLNPHAFADATSSIMKKTLNLTPNVVYTLSANVPNNFNSESGNAFLFIGGGADLSPSSIQNGVWRGQARTITSDSAGKITIGYRVDNINVSDLTDYNIQLESGSAATEYEPYQGKTFAVDFGSTVYGGTLEWDKGLLTVNRKYVAFNGSEAWKVNATSAGYRANLGNVIADYVAPATNTESADAICSHYPIIGATYTWTAAKTGLGFEANGYSLVVYDPERTTSDIEVWKAFLAEQNAAGTPLTVCYKLASPVVVQLSPNDVLAVKGENIVYSDNGETTVTGRKDIVWLTEHLVKKIDELKKAIVALGGNV